ncbi:MAG: hypothetical protein CME61_06825 [Halobacteriovoraceae bacterium]|nr:hypothetical protein [Halobacteriovoraceae bacterium]
MLVDLLDVRGETALDCLAVLGLLIVRLFFMTLFFTCARTGTGELRHREMIRYKILNRCIKEYRKKNRMNLPGN